MANAFLWNDATKCAGKECPKKNECARATEIPIELSDNYFLWTVYNKNNKDCQAFKRKEINDG